MILIQIPLLNRKAMALFPFVLIKKRSYASDPVLINHERIHLRQQVELLILPFYILYLLSFLFHLIRTQNIETAYRSIVFEKEAYACQENPEYLKSRRCWNFRKYI